jgi:hypothetical protein
MPPDPTLNHSGGNMKNQDSTLMRAVWGTALALLFATLPLHAEFREFTGRDGQTMTAELISSSGDKVTLKRKDGRKITTNASVFSNKDQEFIKKWKQDQQSTRIPRLSFEVTTGKSTREADDLGGDYWRQTFEFVASISNDERDFDIDGAKGTLLIFGKHVVDSNQLSVLSRQEFDINLPAGRTLTFRAKKFENTFIDIDYARQGHKYNGYLLVVENAGGKVIAADSAPDSFARFAANALKLKTNDLCDRMLTDPTATHTENGTGGTVILK